MTNAKCILAAIALTGAAVISMSASAYAASGNRSTLGNGEWLQVGSSLFSEDGSVEFKCQTDGKVAIYWGGEARWQNTPQQRYDVKGLIMQGDANVVLYTKDGEAIWHNAPH
ncbi:hypothetical protein ADK64_21060 [Streptomyces sp. MMG1121]|nr:hypothetical protein ADK64_21060 [Streptomyces sp. MMG1121]